MREEPPGRLHYHNSHHPDFPSSQVFEYLSTDLKKWMDKSGKGPAFPLALGTVKVTAAATASVVRGMHSSPHA